MVSAAVAEYLRTLGPVFLRTLGMFALIPLELGFQGTLFKISLAAVFALAFSYDLHIATVVSPSSLAFEFFLGMTLSLPFALVISAAKVLGDLFDTARGQSIADMLDPLHGASSSYTGILLQSFSFATLLSVGALDSIVRSLALSLKTLPLSLQAADFTANALALINFVAASMNAAFFAFLPFALVFFAIEFTCAYLSKLLPRVSLQAESFLLKSWAGIVCLMSLTRFDLTPILLRLATPFERFFN